MAIPSSPVKMVPRPKIEIKNTRDLRSYLVSQMEGVANGVVPPERSKAVANLAQQVYNTLAIEIRFAVTRDKLKDSKIDVQTIEFT
jgi:hypothetical protein